METEREEYALYFIDDEDEPLVIYHDEDEALDLAEMSGSLVMRRVLVVETVGEWEPNVRQPHRKGT